MPLVLESSLAGLPVRRGKVRDIYDLGDRLLLVATDRISAFDYVLPSGIPDKGSVLTQLKLLLVRAAGRAPPRTFYGRQPIRSPARGRSPSTGRPVDSGPQDASRTDRMRGPRLFIGLGLERVSSPRHGLRQRAPPRPCRKRPAARAHLYPSDEGRERARREHFVRGHGLGHWARPGPKSSEIGA